MKINNKDKLIVGFYIFLAISFISLIMYIDVSFQTKYPDEKLTSLVDFFPKPIDELTITRTLNIDSKELFEKMTDVENYPIILPKNVLSVEILEQNDNVVFAIEEIREAGFSATLHAKHTILPYEKHVIEIVDGTAKGTTITQIFENNGDSTKLVTVIDFELNGLLKAIQYFPKSNLVHAGNTIIDSFVLYGHGLDSESKIVDDLYREILNRPADEVGLKHFTALLKSGDMTESDLRHALLTSEEYLSVKNP